MSKLKLVQKLNVIEEYKASSGWDRYCLKNETLNLLNPVPMMRAWDKNLYQNVLIELLPQGCILNMSNEIPPHPQKKHKGYPHPHQQGGHPLEKLVQISHSNLLGVQDTFYCSRMKCFCIVYAVERDSVPLTCFIRKGGERLEVDQIQSVLKQIIQAFAFLEKNQVYINQFNMEDVFVTRDEVTGELHVEIRYIKLGYREDLYHIYVPPESYFRKLINKKQFSSKDIKTLRISWQLGIILIELLRGRQFACWYTQEEYIHTVDIICNYLNNPKIANKFKLTNYITQVLLGMTAVGPEERWNFSKICKYFQIQHSPFDEYRFLDRDDDFQQSIRSGLQSCECDEMEDDESEGGDSNPESEMKEVIGRYIQFYEEAKALQQQNEGKGRSKSRRLSLSECYIQVISGKNFEGLQGHLQKLQLVDDPSHNDSSYSEDTTEKSVTECGDVQTFDRIQSQISRKFSHIAHVQQISSFFNTLTVACFRKKPPQEY